MISPVFVKTTLKRVKGGAVTTDSGTAFHPSTTLFEKQFFRTFSLAIFLNIFSEWPRVCVYDDMVKNFSVSILSIPCMIF